MRKTFLLGLGGNKCGSSWLNRQLCSSPTVDLGDTKEWHVFDVIYTNISDSFYDHFCKMAASSIEDFKSKGKSINPKGMKGKALRQLSFIHDPYKYFEYFEYLYLKDPVVSVVGDITPAYCLLSASALSDIKLLATKFGFHLKVVFIMRDPVDRLWSAARHIYDRGNTQASSPEDVLKTIYNGVQHQARTRYENIITEIDNSNIDTEDVLYLFYEEMFNESTIKTVSSFLSCDLRRFDLSEKVNQSIPCYQNVNLSKMVASYYEETYQFMVERFGSKIPKIWPSYRLLG